MTFSVSLSPRDLYNIIIIKRISGALIYRTRWEHRALYNNTNNTHTRTHARTHARTHKTASVRHGCENICMCMIWHRTEMAIKVKPAMFAFAALATFWQHVKRRQQSPELCDWRTDPCSCHSVRALSQRSQSGSDIRQRWPSFASSLGEQPDNVYPLQHAHLTFLLYPAAKASKISWVVTRWQADRGGDSGVNTVLYLPGLFTCQCTCH